MSSLSRLFFDRGSIEDFKSLLAEDPVKLIKLLFYIRDKKYGAGHRRLFINLFAITCLQIPETISLIEFIPRYGTWKDLVLLGEQLETLVPVIAVHFLIQFKQDLYNIRFGKKISNAAKWFPTPRRKRNHPLVKEMLKLLQANEAFLRRQYLSPLRHYLGLAEIKMSKGYFDEINYDKLPMIAKRRYTDAFWRHDPNFVVNPRFTDVVDLVTEVIRGYEGDVNKEWNRLSKCVLGNTVAVICDDKCKMIQNLIAIALSFNKSNKYTYDNPPRKIEFPHSTILKNILVFADIKGGELVSFNGLSENLIFVITNKPIPLVLKDLSSKVVVWWNIDRPDISITNHSATLIEINGFHLKILNHIIKGGFPKTEYIVENYLRRY